MQYIIIIIKFIQRFDLSTVILVCVISWKRNEQVNPSNCII
jgi:hypothetical protein